MNLKFACSDQFESAEEIAKGIQGYHPNLIQSVYLWCFHHHSIS